MTALSAPNDGGASDWLRPPPCQWEGDKLPKGAYQQGDGYSTGVHLPEHLACVPSSRRESSHVSSQGKEAASVTHDIYNNLSFKKTGHEVYNTSTSIQFFMYTFPLSVNNGSQNFNLHFHGTFSLGMVTIC